jgi:hypothetical protein
VRKQVTRGQARITGQTGGTGSGTRRESARRNTGNEREDAGGTGSSGVGSSTGVGPVAAPGGTWMAAANGWSIVDVETRLPSFPSSIAGGVVVIRSRDV